MLLENYEEYARHARSAFLLSTINEQSYCFPAIHCYCPMTIAAGYIPVFMPLNPAPDQRPELSRSQPRLWMWIKPTQFLVTAKCPWLRQHWAHLLHLKELQQPDWIQMLWSLDQQMSLPQDQLLLSKRRKHQMRPQQRNLKLIRRKLMPGRRVWRDYREVKKRGRVGIWIR